VGDGVKKIISASILSADFKSLGVDLRAAEEAGVDWIHFDVMDGAFVPNISFGIPVLASIREATKLPFDVHLMILDPLRYAKHFRQAGADIITVHAEATPDLPAALEEIRKSGAKAGVSLNPKTPFEMVRQHLPLTDLLLIMAVEPGFGGQSFDTSVLPKINEARKAIDRSGCKTLIEVDGGVNDKTAKAISDAGCDAIVAGSYIFKHPKGIAYSTETLRKSI
jgi:ribulose-phosphate 3-epimerase